MYILLNFFVEQSSLNNELECDIYSNFKQPLKSIYTLSFSVILKSLFYFHSYQFLLNETKKVHQQVNLCSVQRPDHDWLVSFVQLLPIWLPMNKESSPSEDSFQVVLIAHNLAFQWPISFSWQSHIVKDKNECTRFPAPGLDLLTLMKMSSGFHKEVN